MKSFWVTHSPVPVLLCIDIQKEYETEGRAYFIRNLGPSLDRAKRVLEFARNKNWTIFHMRHLQEGDLFGMASKYSEYIEGFEPRNVEREFVKSDYSCFSSSPFSAALRDFQNDEIIVIGYGTTRCCLATIVDGYHRGFKWIFVNDASAAKRSERHDEASLHEYGTDILSVFSRAMNSDELFQEWSRK